MAHGSDVMTTKGVRMIGEPDVNEFVNIDDVICGEMKMESFIGDEVIAEERLIQSEKPLLFELETEVEVEDEGVDVDADPAEVEKGSKKMDAVPAADPTSLVSSRRR
ncbi:hypothetical protein K435DRAFT_870287 [Dendrothele bispora CBS 962.96]|uniref:Uncharacterized protein n=1 Tax=Dendrothele bispora (strain CBS 962.96) TaxID=1314807 RepID=A0A4S8L7C4_DENBC|nr:hypothetical protein K435DRAFT_870287 [Dendrothele bispora CBS 962.96]